MRHRKAIDYTMTLQMYLDCASGTDNSEWKPKHYHADNGCFAEDKFMQDCKDKMQKITFCGVGAHHQKLVVENTIK